MGTFIYYVEEVLSPGGFFAAVWKFAREVLNISSATRRWSFFHFRSALRQT